MNYYELAVKRKSTRAFRNKKVTDKDRKEIMDYMEACRRLVPDIMIRWIMLEEEGPEKLKGCVGYHNFLVEAPCYLLLLSERAPKDMENAGYVGEDMVLKLTEMGLASCWITIQDADQLKKQLGLEGPEMPVALIACGYEKMELGSLRIDIKSPSNVHLKKRSGMIAPKLYLDDAVYEGDWEQTSSVSQLSPSSNLYQAFIAACCAPTALNRQPFRFLMDQNRVYLVILPDELTGEDNARLNTGIVMHHFAMVMGRQNALYGQWELDVNVEKEYHLPEGALVAGSFVI